MLSTFRNPTFLLCCVAVVALANMVTGKSIIRNLLESQAQFAPGPTETRAVTQLGRGRLMTMSLGQTLDSCAVNKDKSLSGKLERICDECYQVYKVSNFHVNCRQSCFDNSLFRGCTSALFQQAVENEFNDFMKNRNNRVMDPPRAENKDLD